MRLHQIAIRHLRANPVLSWVTIASLALSCALISVLTCLTEESKEAFQRDAALFDMVVGGKGSPLQLTLSSIYYLDKPTGNIPLSRYEDLKADRRVARAIPTALGDNYKGFRIVGTVPELFELEALDAEGPFFRPAVGELHFGAHDAVIGSRAAEGTGLAVGNEFSGTHGLVASVGAEVHEGSSFRVTAILEPTGTAQDRAIFVPIESVWNVHEKEQSFRGAFAKRERQEREVTAVLLRLHSPGMRLWMAEEIRDNTEAMAAIPINEILRLNRIVLDPLQQLLLIVTVIVVVVTTLTVFSLLFQAGERRSVDLATARCIGARRYEVFLLLAWEVAILTLAGLVSGLLVGRLGLVWITAEVQRRSGLQLSPWRFSETEATLLLALTAVSLVAGLIPAAKSYFRSPLLALR